MKDIKNISDIPHAIIVNKSVIISILLSIMSLFVQLHNVKLSSSVTFVIYIY